MVIAWTSKVLSEESIKPSDTSDNGLNPRLNYKSNAKIQVKCNGSFLKYKKVSFNH